MTGYNNKYDRISARSSQRRRHTIIRQTVKIPVTEL